MRRAEFERQALEHLDAVHSVVCWILRSRADADDVVQETYLRAFQAIDGFRGQAIKPWLLTIARNLSYTFLSRRSRMANVISFEEAVGRGGDGTPLPMQFPSDEPSAEARMIGQAEAESLRRALEALPLPLRETVELREMEDLSYQQIADVMDVPIGTVMSRLSRARGHLRALLAEGEDRHAV